MIIVNYANKKLEEEMDINVDNAQLLYVWIVQIEHFMEIKRNQFILMI